MRDAATKILIVSSPKAGATLAQRIMLARLNLTGVAAAYRGKHDYSGYPLFYAHEVFQKQRSAGRYPDANHLADCADPSWLCIALVRTPLDRAVSSYVHSLKHFANVGAWAGVSPNASFADFALDLDRRAHDRGESRNDVHFMPQISPAPHVLSVPIEMLSEPDGYACPLLERLQGWRVAELEAEALGLRAGMPGHYITQAASGSGSEHWPWPRLHPLAKASRRRGFPSYDSFFSNKSFCRHVVGCLYRDDLRTYHDACRGSRLRVCPAYRRACEAQLARLRDVCGVMGAAAQAR